MRDKVEQSLSLLQTFTATRRTHVAHTYRHYAHIALTHARTRDRYPRDLKADTLVTNTLTNGHGQRYGTHRAQLHSQPTL